MALPKKYSNQYISSEGVVMETEPNGEVVIKQIPQTLDELPAVSGTDNGKVLKVVEGAWAAATAPAGGGLLKIETTIDEAENTMSLDKTWTEIHTAWEAGILPILDSQGIGYFEGAYDESEAYTVYFYIPGVGIIQFGSSDADDYPTYILTIGGGGNEGGGEGMQPT